MLDRVYVVCYACFSESKANNFKVINNTATLVQKAPPRVGPTTLDLMEA